MPWTTVFTIFVCRRDNVFTKLYALQDWTHNCIRFSARCLAASHVPASVAGDVLLLQDGF